MSKSTQQYKIRRLPDTPFVWRDGLGLVSYKGRLYVIMGWNPAWGNQLTPASNTREVWSTTDGVAWRAEAQFPGSPSHTFGCEVKDGLIWVFGTDGQNVGVGGKPYVYTYDGTTWTKISDSWGIDVGESRILFGSCVHKGYLYVVGGQNNVYTSAATFFNDIQRSVDGVVWEKVADLPVAMHNRAMPNVYSLNGKIYVAGGFTYTEPNRAHYTGIFASENDGLSFSMIGDIPVATGYQNRAVFDDKLWLLDGYKVYEKYPAEHPNRKGVHFSEDGVSWRTFNVNLGDPTHATGFCEHAGRLWIVQGNGTNQVVEIKKSI